MADTPESLPVEPKKESLLHYAGNLLMATAVLGMAGSGTIHTVLGLHTMHQQRPEAREAWMRALSTGEVRPEFSIRSGDGWREVPLEVAVTHPDSTYVLFKEGASGKPICGVQVPTQVLRRAIHDDTSMPASAQNPFSAADLSLICRLTPEEISQIRYTNNAPDRFELRPNMRPEQRVTHIDYQVSGLDGATRDEPARS